MLFRSTSLYLYGWGGSITDAEIMMTPVLRNRGENGVGYNNFGGARNDRADQLAASSSIEADPVKREQLVKSALREFKDSITIIPLHRQMIPWAVRQNVQAVHRSDNWLEVAWVNVGSK